MTTLNGVNFTRTGDPQADLVTYANARGISQAEAKKELEAEFGTPEKKATSASTSSSEITTDSQDSDVALKEAVLNLINSDEDDSTKLNNFFKILIQLLSKFKNNDTDSTDTTTSSSNSSTVKDTDYTYYSDGAIKTKTIKYDDGSETVENYNSKGELTSKQETKSDGSYTKTTYYSDGTEKQVTSYDASTKYKTVAKYNSDGELTSSTTNNVSSSDNCSYSSSCSSTSSSCSSSSSTSSNTDSYKTERDEWQDKLKTATAYGDKKGIKAAQKAIKNLDKARAKGLPPKRK